MSPQECRAHPKWYKKWCKDYFDIYDKISTSTYRNINRKKNNPTCMREMTVVSESSLRQLHCHNALSILCLFSPEMNKDSVSVHQKVKTCVYPKLQTVRWIHMMRTNACHESLRRLCATSRSLYEPQSFVPTFIVWSCVLHNIDAKTCMVTCKGPFFLRRIRRIAAP